MNQYAQYNLVEATRQFMYKVYGWMAAGLALTAATSLYVFNNPSLFNYLFRGSIIPFVLMGAQLLLVFALAGLITRMSFATAVSIFIAYAILTGLTLSSIFYVYRLEAIVLAFSITTVMFTAMALYGYFTKADLTAAGSVAQMAVWGILIAMLVNIFMKSAGLDYIISLIGVGIFTVLIAYDNQKLKQIGQTFYAGGDIEQKASLLGALTLYLDFINLFLFLLRLLGGNKRND
ncbi:MAG: Bax inhibitor-1/YccA family protein [Candidatus Babeliales bacterium]